MASKSEKFLTPVGRLVQGDCFEAQTKDQAGVPLTIKTGPNAGQPTQKYFIAVAFKKTDPETIALKAQWDRKAREEFPALFPNPSGPCVNPNFSDKITDGDGIDQNGKPNNTKDGFAGCWVFRFSSSFPPECYARGAYNPATDLLKPGQIPRGHHIRVSGTISGNQPSNKPGLYVNLGMIEWNSIGDLITSGPSASDVFGGGAAAVPPAGPVMLAAAGATPYAAYIAAGWTDAALIAAQMMAPPAAAVAPPPAPPAAVAPPPPPAPLPPGGSAPPPPPPAQIAPAAPGYRMTEHAGATTYQQYLHAGWSDAALVQNNFMVPA